LDIKEWTSGPGFRGTH